MKKAKRIVGLLTVVVMLFSLFCTTGYAFGGDVALRSLEFRVNSYSYGTPSNGDTINVTVRFDNTTDTAVKRTIMLAAYDADGKLIELTTNEVSVSPTTDWTKSKSYGEELTYTDDMAEVKAIIWENGASAVPVYTRTFTAMPEKGLGINGVWIVVGGEEREGTVDNINKTLTVEVPDYDKDGNAVTLGKHGIKIRGGELYKVVDADGEQWNLKDEYYHYKELDLSNGGCNIFLENVLNSNIETYKLVVCRTVEEDFETFSGEFKGNESAATKDTIEQGTYTGTWKIGNDAAAGVQRKMWFTAMASPNKKNDIAADAETGTEAYSYTDAMTIKAVDAADVKMLDDSTKTLNSGITNAGGKVMMINKPSNGNSATDTASYGTVELRVGTSTRFKGAQNAIKLTFEYDAAYGTSLNDAEHAGRVGGLTAGAHVYGGESFYTGNKGKVIARLSGHNAVLNDSARFQYQAGKQALDTAQQSTEDMSQWRRVKLEFTRPSADSDDITVKTYYDGILQSKEYNSKDAEEEGADNWAWPTQLVFRTASNRSCQMYIDNLKITWDTPGDYTAKPQMLKSLKIDKYAGVLSGDTITVDIPVYDADGAALNIDPAWTTTVEVKDADTTVTIGDTALTGDGKSKTATIDYTNGGCNVKIGEDTYKLVINRCISENFESGFSGELTTAADAKISVSGTERSGWFDFVLKKASDDTYNTDKKISFINQSDVKKLDNAAEKMPAGTTSASGNVLALVNPKNGNPADGSTKAGYGYVGMTIGGAEKYKEYGADKATTMSFEYDIAYGNTDCEGYVSAFMSGAYINSSGNTVARLGGAFAGLTSETKHNYQAGADATVTATSASADMSQWRHVKVEFTRNSADSDTATIAVYYDGVKQSKTWNDSACKWPDAFELKTTPARACKMYVDNIKLSWNTEGEYRKTYLKTFDVMGKDGTVINKAEITKDTVTVTLPLYNADGSAFDMTDLTVGTNVGGERNAVTVYTSSEDTTGAEFYELRKINFGDVGDGAKIVVGDATYALKLRRQLFDNFDDKTLFKGATAASVTDAGVMSFVAATADRNLVGADGETAITGKGDFASAISVGHNQQWKFATDGTDSAKATAVENSVDIGLANLSNAVFNNNEKSFASGNALRVAKRLAYTGKDTSAPYIDIKVNCNDSESAVYEFDLGFDYSKCTMGTDYSVGSTSAGIRIFNNNTQLVQVVGSQNGLTEDKRSEGKLNGSNYTLDKFHHIKVEFANGTYSLYIDDMKTAVSSGTADNMPNCFKIFTSTLRACEIYVDNIDISYSVN